MKALLVEWIDSASDHGWEKIKDSEIEHESCITLGFLVKESEDFIMIAHSIDQANDSANGRIQIPKVAIKSRKVIQWKPKGSPKKRL